MSNGTHALHPEPDILYPGEVGIDFEKLRHGKKGFFRKYGKWAAISLLPAAGLVGYLASNRGGNDRATGEQLNAAVNQPGIQLTTGEIAKRETQKAPVADVKSAAAIPSDYSGIDFPANAQNIDASDYANLKTAMSSFVEAYNSKDHKKLEKMTAFVGRTQLVGEHAFKGAKDGDEYVKSRRWNTLYDVFQNPKRKMTPEEFAEFKNFVSGYFDDAVAKYESKIGSGTVREIRVFETSEGIGQTMGGSLARIETKEQYDNISKVYQIILDDGNGYLTGITFGKTSSGFKFLDISF